MNNHTSFDCFLCFVALDFLKTKIYIHNPRNSKYVILYQSSIFILNLNSEILKVKGYHFLV